MAQCLIYVTSSNYLSAVSYTIFVVSKRIYAIKLSETSLSMGVQMAMTLWAGRNLNGHVITQSKDTLFIILLAD